MDEKTRIKLQKLYTEDIGRLSKILDRDLNFWIK
jgi:hypothetical protein